MSKKSKKTSAVDSSQEPLDYSIIEKLREDAWKHPEVRKNWKKFDRMGLTIPQVQPEARQAQAKKIK